MRSAPSAALDDDWFPRRLGPVLLAAAFVALARWSWLKWPDVLVDFGSQLYIPWQLVEGKRLYVDIAYKDGPLAQYVNALWFTLFGVSLRTIVWCNLALLGLLCALVYALFARAFGRFTATLVVAVQLAVFSFSQYTGIANYNYVCPYAQEQTHGLLAAVAMIFALGELANGGRPRWAIGAGAAFALAALTKAELSVPALGAAILGLVLVAVTRPRDETSLPAVLLAFAGGVAVPIFACVALLATRMPWATALSGAAGNWVHLHRDILDYPFYRTGMGMDDPSGNLLVAATFAGAVAVTVGAAAAVAWATRRVRRGNGVVALGVGAALVAVLLAWVASGTWTRAGRVLPLTTAVALAGFVAAAVVGRRRPDAAQRFVVPAIWAAFALALLGKVVLNVRISHYGFVLAMPATLLLVATFARVIPAAFAERGGNGTLARAVLLAPIIAATIFFFRWSDRVYATKSTVLPLGRDSFVVGDDPVDPRGRMLMRAVEELRARMPPGATLMTIPDGLVLNYWLRRAAPTEHVYFVPWTFEYAGGEAAVLRDIQAHPPDFVVVVDRKATEHGFAAFGEPGFGGLILPWVRANYRRIARYGNEPLTGQRGFGVLVLAYEPRSG